MSLVGNARLSMWRIDPNTMPLYFRNTFHNLCFKDEMLKVCMQGHDVCHFSIYLNTVLLSRSLTEEHALVGVGVLTL